MSNHHPEKTTLKGSTLENSKSPNVADGSRVHCGTPIPPLPFLLTSSSSSVDEHGFQPKFWKSATDFQEKSRPSASLQEEEKFISFWYSSSQKSSAANSPWIDKNEFLFHVVRRLCYEKIYAFLANLKELYDGKQTVEETSKKAGEILPIEEFGRDNRDLFLSFQGLLVSSQYPPPERINTEIDGMEFFLQVRSRLSDEQLRAFSSAMEELNAGMTITKKEALRKAEEIFGTDNRDLFLSFQELLVSSQKSYSPTKEGLQQKSYKNFRLQPKSDQNARLQQKSDQNARLQQKSDQNARLQPKSDENIGFQGELISFWYSSRQKSSAANLPWIDEFLVHVWRCLSDELDFKEKFDSFWYPPGVKKPCINKYSVWSYETEFLFNVSLRLSDKQMYAFVANLKELSLWKQTVKETSKKAGEIFGTDNRDLFLLFQGLLIKNEYRLLSHFRPEIDAMKFFIPARRCLSVEQLHAPGEETLRTVEEIFGTHIRDLFQDLLIKTRPRYCTQLVSPNPSEHSDDGDELRPRLLGRNAKELLRYMFGTAIKLAYAGVSIIKSDLKSFRKLLIPRIHPKFWKSAFLFHVGRRLSEKQMYAFLANLKELYDGKQTLEETSKKADEIFGTDNRDLFLSFQGLLVPSQHPPPERINTEIDGMEFFLKVRRCLSDEQLRAFSSAMEELNAELTTEEEALRKADEIFGTDNRDLFPSFQGLLVSSQKSYSPHSEYSSEEGLPSASLQEKSRPSAGFQEKSRPRAGLQEKPRASSGFQEKSAGSHSDEDDYQKDSIQGKLISLWYSSRQKVTSRYFENYFWIDENDFLFHVRRRLSDEQIYAFLANLRELYKRGPIETNFFNQHKNSVETLKKVGQIFGTDNRDLFVSFQGLLVPFLGGSSIRSLIKGIRFFQEAWESLSLEQVVAFASAMEELNAEMTTKEETLRKAEEIFGTHLFLSFRALLVPSQKLSAARSPQEGLGDLHLSHGEELSPLPLSPNSREHSNFKKLRNVRIKLVRRLVWRRQQVKTFIKVREIFGTEEFDEFNFKEFI